MRVKVRPLRNGGRNLRKNAQSSGPPFVGDLSVWEELDHELGRIVLRATGPPMRLRHMPVRNPRTHDGGRARGCVWVRPKLCKAPASGVATWLAPIRRYFLGSQPTSVCVQ
jgi:hypothetical protein